MCVDVLFEGNKEECYLKEETLRPEKGIGWNINKGGTKPPDATGKKNALGCRGPTKQVISPDGMVFASRKEAAKFYNVNISTIYNWMKDPTKPWKKMASVQPKYNISKHVKTKPIMTPRGKFESVKSASEAYNVVHGTIGYWLKTRTSDFYYLT